MKNSEAKQTLSNKTFSNNLPKPLPTPKRPQKPTPKAKIKSMPQSKNQKPSKSRAMLTPLQIFEKLCEIPHRSHHTQKMFEYLCTFCKNIGLEVRTDRAKNIYVCQKPQKIHAKNCVSKNHLPKSHLSKNHLSKNCSPKIYSPKICLQAHYDMVGVGKAQSGEAIEPYIDKQFLRARESSLGADNGAGLASILWLFMQEKYAPHIEAIFTNNEEVGLCGANELELPIKSRFLLNVDSEFFGEIITGCAGGFDIEFDFDAFEIKQTSETGQNLFPHLYEIKAFGFEGGHSGVDIHRNIRSSIVDFAHLLQTLCDIQKSDSSFFCELYSLNAGEKSNSIPVGLSAFMGFSSDIETLLNTLKNAGLCVSKENLYSLRVGLPPKDMTKSTQNLKTGFLIKYHRNIGDYQQILEQKPQKCYDKKLLSTLILELKHGVWEKKENGEVLSSLNIAMIEDNSSFCDDNLSLDSHCAVFVANNDNSSSQTSDSERGNQKSPSPNYQNLSEGATNDKNNPPSPNHQNVAEGVRGRVKSTLESVPKSSLDSNAKSSLRASDSEGGTRPQLQSNDLARKRGCAQLHKQKPQTTICHTEVVQATEVSQSQLKNRDISAFSKPQYDKNITEKTMDCHANADAFARNDEKNPPSLAEGVRGRVDFSVESSLQADLQNPRGKTRQNRSLFSNPQNSPQNSKIDCHDSRIFHKSLESRNDDTTSKTKNFTPEISKNPKQKRDTSIFQAKPQQTKPHYDKNNITCHANADAFAHNDSINPTLHFTLKARANTNPLLAKIKKQTIQTIANLLANPPHTPSPNISNEYSAWADSNEQKALKARHIHPILQMIIDAYKWRHCAVGSIHAGLECGILQERFHKMGLKNIAMASIGPTILSPHSLQERLDIDSFYEFVEVLESLIASICASEINN